MKAVIAEFKDFYRDIRPINTGHFERIYHDNVTFRDPVHEIRGAANLHAYLEMMCANLESGKFEYLDEIIAADSAYIKWNMNFRHPRLGDRVHSVRGISHVLFDERIYYHEDAYDLGQMLYEHVPLLGAMTRWVKGRLTA